LTPSVHAGHTTAPSPAPSPAPAGPATYAGDGSWGNRTLFAAIAGGALVCAAVMLLHPRRGPF